MVCPNCHSTQIITVQDQQFCINCGQMVPDGPAKAKSGGLKVQQNGLPVGVKILGAPGAAAPEALAKPAATRSQKAAAAPAVAAAEPLVPQAKSSGLPAEATVPSLVRARQRLAISSEAPPVKPRKRKPGRPKAGRLDVPKIPVAATATTSVVSSPQPSAIDPVPPVGPVPAPQPKPAPQPVPAPSPVPNPQPKPAKVGHHKTAHSAHSEHSVATSTEDRPSRGPLVADLTAPKPKQPVPPHHRVHQVGVAPLHFGQVIGASLRTQFRSHHLLLASLAAAVLAVAAGAGSWLFLSGQLPGIARQLVALRPQMVAELALLALLYYIGRSLGGAAIIYGAAREIDHRPAGLGVQLGVAINGFSRRLGLDLVFGAAQVSLLAAMALLVITGGTPWQLGGYTLNSQVQIGAVFTLFLLLLYLMTALALSHGLATVALVLTKNRSTEAAKLGWRLFSHRFELLGWRFVSLALEMLIAIPLAAAAVALLVTVPTGLMWLVSLAVGVLAWFIGAIMGSGTATWWATLYRKLVLVDHPAAEAALLSSRPPAEASRPALTALVAVSSFLIAASLAIPWLRFG